MKGILRRLRPSPAMVVACTALLFAMTGAGYAAGMLGPNTVGTKQLKKNAVISSKVKNGSLLRADFKSGQVPQGPKGDKGDKGDPGAPGQQGPPGPFPDPLQAGKTIRGSYASATNGGALLFAGVDFVFRLAAALPATYIKVGTPPPAQCPGTAQNPQAAAGNLCVYETEASGVGASRGVCDPSRPGCIIGVSAREGFAVYSYPTGASAWVFGTWAATPATGSMSSLPEGSGGTAVPQ